MKTRELFAVAVKCVGLYFIVQGIYRLMQIVDVVAPIVTTEARFDPGDRLRIGFFLFAGVLHFAISAFFLRSDWLVSLAFPRDSTKMESSTNKPS